MPSFSGTSTPDNFFFLLAEDQKHLNFTSHIRGPARSFKTKMAGLDEILTNILSSVNATSGGIEALSEKLEANELPSLATELLQKTGTSVPEGVSLLDLKNHAMLSYLNNLCLIVLSKVEALKTNNTKEIEEVRLNAVKNTIVQRVTMERGVKNLEKKLNYQLEKMVRNYNKMDKESTEYEKNLSNGKKEAKQGRADGEGGSESGSGSDDDDSESDSEDELNYRPDASALIKASQSKSKFKSKPSASSKRREDQDDEEETKASAETYKPPKIAAALPPTEFKDTNTRKQKNARKLQAMEEYLQETGDAPMLESSTGSNILNNGRGGVQTAKDKQKEEEIRRYEESNFTRLSNNMAKKEQKGKKRHNVDTFFGEDWSIFNNSRDDGNMNTSRKSKPHNAWDRAKKRRNK